jgi:hypothetical protein
MLRFANALLNTVLPYVDKATWLCDFRGGSRRSQIVPFYNAAPATLYLHDPRPELTDTLVQEHVTVAIDKEWRRCATTGTIDNYRLRGYGLTLLNLLLAASPDLKAKLNERRSDQLRGPTEYDK